MQGTYLGQSCSTAEITSSLDTICAAYQVMTYDEMYRKVAGLLADAKIIGWFQGCGVRSARAGCPLHPWRSSKPVDAEDDEYEDQVS